MINPMHFIGGWGFNPDIGRLVFSNLSDVHSHESIDVLAKKIMLPSILIGWSLGGLRAIQFAAQYPERVSKLVLINATPCFLAQENWAGVVETQANALLGNIHKFPQYVQYPSRDKGIHDLIHKYYVEGDVKVLKQFFYTDEREAFSQLSMPIDLVIGKKDCALKVSKKNILALNPSVNVIEFEEAGHFLMMTHKPLLAEKVA